MSFPTLDKLLEHFRQRGAALPRGEHARYDKGWVPGPDANWQRKSPDEMAKTLGRSHVPTEPKTATGKTTQLASPDEMAKSLSSGTPQPSPTTTPNPSPASSPASSPTSLPPESAQVPAAMTSTAKEPAGSQASPLAKGGPSPEVEFANTPGGTSFVQTSPDEMAKRLATPQSAGQSATPAQSAPPATPAPAPSASVPSLFDTLPKGKSGYPLAVENAVKRFAPSNIRPGSPDYDDLLQQASIGVLEGQDKAAAAAKPEDFAYTAAYNALADAGRKKTAKKRGADRTKGMGEDFDPAQRESAPLIDPLDMDAFRAAVADLDPQDQDIAMRTAAGESLRDIANATGSNPAKVRKTLKGLEATFKEFMERRAGGKDRYSRFNASLAADPHEQYGLRAPLLPAVWEEIIDQAKQYGPKSGEFVRCVMEAMRDSATQWDAILNGRRKFLSMSSGSGTGGSRYEYGPRHQPPKRLDGAVARLQALAEYAGEIDYEALEDEVTGIAREFDAEDLKEIAKRFGVKKGLGTKAAALDGLLAKVVRGKVE